MIEKFEKDSIYLHSQWGVLKCTQVDDYPDGGYFNFLYSKFEEKDFYLHLTDGYEEGFSVICNKKDFIKL
jgi:hypothetical protein